MINKTTNIVLEKDNEEITFYFEANDQRGNYNGEITYFHRNGVMCKIYVPDDWAVTRVFQYMSSFINLNQQNSL